MSRGDITIYKGDYIHESTRIGNGTRIGGGHDIGKDVVIGEDCNIQCGVFISNEWRIGDRVFIGPGTRFFNDKYPPPQDRDRGGTGNTGAGETSRYLLKTCLSSPILP